MADLTVSNDVDTMMGSGNNGAIRSNIGANDAANLSAGVLADARVQESNVTQHEAAIDALNLVNAPAEAAATADQTDAEIKTAYENNANTNAFTDAEKTNLGNQSGTNTGDESAASTTVSGIVELATIAETDTGTDATRSVTPAGLAGSALQTKVDGIEALADVTDTTNVTAAGAVMDSELTNETAVKAIDQGLATTDSPQFDKIELGNASDTTLTRSAAGVLAVEGVDVISEDTVFYEEIVIPAGAMTPRGTNPAEASSESTTTNDVTIDYFLFDSTTEEGVQFPIPLPDSWDLSTIKAKFEWDGATGASASDAVTWGIAVQSWADNDALDSAFPTATTVADTLHAVGDYHETAATGAVTVSGSPAKGHAIYAEVTRAASGMAEDAKLKSVKIQFGRKISNSTAW